jgi:spore maturation protein CgeB
MKPTIAFFGSSLVSAYWNGAATYYRGIIRALAARGYTVTFYEPDAYDRQAHRDIPDPSWATVVVYAAGAGSSGKAGASSLAADERGVRDALRQARGADIIVKTSGVGAFDELLDEAVLDQRTPGSQVIFWDVDAPATLERLAATPDDPFRRLVGEYDRVLTYGGGEPVVQGYAAAGARECIPVYNALDPDTHYPVAPDPRFNADVSFLGNRLPDREARVEQFLFTAAREYPGASFLLGGSGWGDKAVPGNVRYVGHVYTRDHNAFNCTPRAVLNISRDSMARFGYSPATRVFEAAGAGACLITDAWDGIEQFLEPDREVLVARDGAEVGAHVATLDADRARRIGAAARRRVLAEHTYARRAEQLDRLFEQRDVARALVS